MSEWNDAIVACANACDNYAAGMLAASNKDQQGYAGIAIIGAENCAKIIRALKRPEGNPRPISEVTIPAAEVINMPCKGCGKRPIDFIS